MIAKIRNRLREALVRFLIPRSNRPRGGAKYAWLASRMSGCYKEKANLAYRHPSGFTSHSASIGEVEVLRGNNVYLGDRVVLYGTAEGGSIELGDKVALYSDIIIETHERGRVRIGAGSHIQPRCQFVAALESIEIGERCEIAPACAFYPFDHAMDSHKSIMEQGLRSRGSIVVGDDVWLGYGVVVLQGVTIGDGAVIGANSVVTKDIPPNAIAVGSPAKVLKLRS